MAPRSGRRSRRLGSRAAAVEPLAAAEPLADAVPVVDPESRLEVPASVTDVRAAYRSTVEEVIEEWRSMLASFGVSYEVVITDRPFGVPLRRAFAARQRLPSQKFHSPSGLAVLNRAT